MKTITLSVRGMTCNNCVKHVGEALRGVAGVTRAEVDLAGARAVVDAADDVALDALLAALADDGYDASAA